MRVYVRPGMRMSLCVSVRQLEGAGVVEDAYACVTAVCMQAGSEDRSSKPTHPHGQSDLWHWSRYV